jgi:hypothetical protein
VEIAVTRIAMRLLEYALLGKNIKVFLNKCEFINYVENL